MFYWQPPVGDALQNEWCQRTVMFLESTLWHQSCAGSWQWQQKYFWKIHNSPNYSCFEHKFQIPRCTSLSWLISQPLCIDSPLLSTACFVILCSISQGTKNTHRCNYTLWVKYEHFKTKQFVICLKSLPSWTLAYGQSLNKIIVMITKKILTQIIAFPKQEWHIRFGGGTKMVVS